MTLCLDKGFNPWQFPPPPFTPVHVCHDGKMVDGKEGNNINQDINVEKRTYTFFSFHTNTIMLMVLLLVMFLMFYCCMKKHAQAGWGRILSLLSASGVDQIPSNLQYAHQQQTLPISYAQPLPIAYAQPRAIAYQPRRALTYIPAASTVQQPCACVTDPVQACTSQSGPPSPPVRGKTSGDIEMG